MVILQYLPIFKIDNDIKALYSNPLYYLVSPNEEGYYSSGVWRQDFWLDMASSFEEKYETGNVFPNGYMIGNADNRRVFVTLRYDQWTGIATWQLGNGTQFDITTNPECILTLSNFNNKMDQGNFDFGNNQYYSYINPNFIGSRLIFMNFNTTNLTAKTSEKDGIGGGGFEPNPGLPPDKGGGNQDWGQGSPTTSTEGGTYDNTSDTVGTGTATSIKAGQAFNNYFVLNLNQVFEVKNKIWGLNLPWLTRPTEAIINLLLFPLNLDSRSFDSTSVRIDMGNSSIDLTTNVWLLNANYNNVLDIGTITLAPYFNGFQDYAPHTKIKIYLPFIGVKDLDPTFVQGKALNVKYYIDFSLGKCAAVLTSDGVFYTKFEGQIAQTVPLTQVDNKMLEATLSTALSVGVAAATGGLSAVVDKVPSALSTLSASKPSISGSNASGGEIDLSLPLDTFLIIERPQCAIAQTYNAEKGRPSLVNKQLSNCKGFTSMVDPKVNALCTSTENDRINTLLKQGVIINVSE